MSKTILKRISIFLSLLSLSIFFTDTALSKNHRHHRLHRHKHVASVKHRKSQHSKQVASQEPVNHPTTPVSKVSAEQISATNNVNPKVWQLAVKAYNTALQKGYIKQKMLTIIDYSLPSSKKRLWVVDLQNRKIVMNTLVAHGKHTGDLYAKHFSDQPGSLESSLGTFVTENTYSGSHGLSLRLRGLEPGFNDMAKSRAIVIHPAWYATQDFANSHGRLGLSWGCPAVSPQIATPLINKIKNGTLVFAYYPDKRWLNSSRFLS